MLKEAIAKIVTGQHLDEQQMTDVMHKIMSNQDNIEILSGQ